MRAISCFLGFLSPVGHGQLEPPHALRRALAPSLGLQTGPAGSRGCSFQNHPQQGLLEARRRGTWIGGRHGGRPVAQLRGNVCPRQLTALLVHEAQSTLQPRSWEQSRKHLSEEVE